MRATSAGPAVRAARGGLAGRRVQAMVIGLVVLVSTAASTLALGLLVDSNAPFDHAFAAQHGAQVMATVTPSAQLAATTRLPGVTAAAGPFAETTVNALIHWPSGPGHPAYVEQTQLNVVGRASPGGPVDDLTLTAGRWPRQDGEIVLDRDRAGAQALLGSQVTVTGVPGSPRLTVVGFASSITRTAQAWVLPAEMAALRAPGAPPVAQMLYRFSSAGTNAEVNADIAAIRAALPHGALLGAQSYLTVKLQATGSIAPWVPFIVAFGLIGLVMSVLIVANVVSGAVVAGTRRIGVLKSIGFSPGQVVAAYLIQVAVPALAGCVAGVLVGNLLSVPLLGQTAQVYGVGALAVPFWVDLAVPLAMLALTGAAALAAGAARGAAERGAGHRDRPGAAPVRRVRGAPAARPGPLGPAAAPAGDDRAGRPVRAAGSHRGHAGGDRVRRARGDVRGRPGHVAGPGRGRPVARGGPAGAGQPARIRARRRGEHHQTGHAVPACRRRLAAQERAVQAALRAQPGTLHYVAEADDEISVLGLADRLSLDRLRRRRELDRVRADHRALVRRGRPG